MKFSARAVLVVRAAFAVSLLGILSMSAWLCSGPAYAVPANPKPAIVVQPDGLEVMVRLRGDEHVHWYEDMDGYLVVKSPQTNQWVYAIEVDGAILPTDLVVGRVDPRAAGLAKPDTSRIVAAARAPRSPMTPDEEQPPRVPLTGTMRNLVVLVDFSDLTIAYTRQEFDDLFNQVGYTVDGAVGSVRDYYDEVSYSTLTVQSTVEQPVTISNGYAYYGANDAYGYDLRPREMVQEALAALEARGFDFSTMDGDSDGWVDGLTIIHAGGGEEYAGNDPDYIWSHQWQLLSPVTYDGVSMQVYHTEPARRGWDSYPSTWGITRIGVICHENGHFLGLPDLYDYGYDSKGAGDFCLMAGGSWNGDAGTTPAHMSAWCKADLGWITPTVISSVGSYSISQVETSGQVYKLQGPFPANEYFLVENRQGVGFDAGLPGSSRGILIWHVDENQPDNDDQTHYKVDVEEASCTQHLELNLNDGDDYDYYRSGNATSFTNISCPSNLSYSLTPLGLDITNVGATGVTMPFDVTLSSSCGGWQTIKTEDFDGPWPNDWQLSSNYTSGGTPITWGPETYRYYSSPNGGWPHASVADPNLYYLLTSNPGVPIDSRMTYGPFDLSNATDANMTFYLWYDLGPGDSIEWYASTNGVNFYGYYLQGGWYPLWSQYTFDLKSVPTLGNLCGSPTVYVMFRCLADDQQDYVDGPFLDDIVISKYVCAAPEITTHPASQVACVGDSAQFCVTATGTPPLSYQWRKDGSDIPGATSDCYAIPSCDLGDAGDYDCVVSNSCGSITSDPAGLAVGDICLATIREAKERVDGTSVVLADKTVMGSFTDFFYVEEMDRSAGVRVNATGHSVQVGDNVKFAGTLGLDDGERVINASEPLIIQSSGNPVPAALDLRSRAVGGVGYANNPGVTNGRGALNVGLHVRYMGMVTHVNADPAYLYVWEGANHIYPGGSLPVDDGTGNGPGVRIETTQGQALTPWTEWVEITGIVSTAEITPTTHIIPTIIPTETIIVTSAFDTITACSLCDGWSLIGLPAAPAGIGDGVEHSPKPWDPPVVFTGGDPFALDARMRKWESCDQSLYAWDMWMDDHVANLAWGPFGGTLLGDGYWFDMGPQAISYQGKLSDLDQWISICQPGWILIGHPKDTNIALEDVKVHDGSQVKTMLEASQWNANWLNSIGYRWDCTVQALVDIGLYEWDFPETDMLQPCHGYWFQIVQGDKAFIIPEVTTYVPPW